MQYLYEKPVKLYRVFLKENTNNKSGSHLDRVILDKKSNSLKYIDAPIITVSNDEYYFMDIITGAYYVNETEGYLPNPTVSNFYRISYDDYSKSLCDLLLSMDEDDIKRYYEKINEIYEIAYKNYESMSEMISNLSKKFELIPTLMKANSVSEHTLIKGLSKRSD